MNKIKKENLFYIDSIEGYNLALQSYDANTDLIVTDNPFIANDPNNTNYIEDISKHLSQEKANEIGKKILSMSNEIENIFIKKNYNNSFKYFSKKIGLYLAIRTMLNTTIEKSLIFSLFLEKIKVNKIYFFINRSVSYEEIYPWIFPRFCNVYKFLAEKLFFADIPIEIKEISINEPKNVNETSERNIILRTITWPISYLLFRLINFCKFFSKKKKTIFYLRTCESLSETLARLFFKGYKITPLKLPKIDHFSLQGYEEKKNILTKDLDVVLNKYLSLFFSSRSEIISQKKIIIEHILLGLLKLNSDSTIYAKFFSELKSTNTIITAGFYGPIANQLFYLCKKYKIKLIGFEHGVTAGINKDTSSYIKHLESTTVDLLMVSNLAAKKEFMRANLLNEESKQNSVYVAGEAEQKKNIFFYKLQRYFLNNRYSISDNDETIVHVSGILYSGNLRNAPSSPTMNNGFEREKSLLTKVYNEINKKVFYKKYPSQRLLYQPCFSEIFNLANNITILKDADFRYMRAIADIIVTDSNYSTLGWCVIKDIPLIYLMSRKFNPLFSLEVENLFIESFLVINCDKDGWELQLKKLLNLPKRVLKDKWKNKKAKRTFLIKNYIHGPSSKSSISAANYIDKYV